MATGEQWLTSFMTQLTGSPVTFGRGDPSQPMTALDESQGPPAGFSPDPNNPGWYFNGGDPEDPNNWWDGSGSSGPDPIGTTYGSPSGYGTGYPSYGSGGYAGTGTPSSSGSGLPIDPATGLPTAYGGISGGTTEPPPYNPFATGSPYGPSPAPALPSYPVPPTPGTPGQGPGRWDRDPRSNMQVWITPDDETAWAAYLRGAGTPSAPAAPGNQYGTTPPVQPPSYPGTSGGGGAAPHAPAPPTGQPYQGYNPNQVGSGQSYNYYGNQGGNSNAYSPEHLAYLYYVANQQNTLGQQNAGINQEGNYLNYNVGMTNAGNNLTLGQGNQYLTNQGQQFENAQFYYGQGQQQNQFNANLALQQQSQNNQFMLGMGGLFNDAQRNAITQLLGEGQIANEAQRNAITQLLGTGQLNLQQQQILNDQQKAAVDAVLRSRALDQQDQLQAMNFGIQSGQLQIQAGQLGVQQGQLGVNSRQVDQQYQLGVLNAMIASEGNQIRREELQQQAATLQANIQMEQTKLLASLRGPRDAYAQQRAMAGINAQGQSNALAALNGGPDAAAFNPSGGPEAVNYNTFMQDSFGGTPAGQQQANQQGYQQGYQQGQPPGGLSFAQWQQMQQGQQQPAALPGGQAAPAQPGNQPTAAPPQTQYTHDQLQQLFTEGRLDLLNQLGYRGDREQIAGQLGLDPNWTRQGQFDQMAGNHPNESGGGSDYADWQLWLQTPPAQGGGNGTLEYWQQNIKPLGQTLTPFESSYQNSGIALDPREPFTPEIARWVYAQGPQGPNWHLFADNGYQGGSDEIAQQLGVTPQQFFQPGRQVDDGGLSARQAAENNRAQALGWLAAGQIDQLHANGYLGTPDEIRARLEGANPLNIPPQPSAGNNEPDQFGHDMSNGGWAPGATQDPNTPHWGTDGQLWWGGRVIPATEGATQQLVNGGGVSTLTNGGGTTDANGNWLSGQPGDYNQNYNLWGSQAPGGGELLGGTQETAPPAGGELLGGTEEIQTFTPTRTREIPSYDVGKDYIPEDQIAQVHEGEMIFPEKDAGALREAGITPSTFSPTPANTSSPAPTASTFSPTVVATTPNTSTQSFFSSKEYAPETSQGLSKEDYYTNVYRPTPVAQTFSPTVAPPPPPDPYAGMTPSQRNSAFLQNTQAGLAAPNQINARNWFNRTNPGAQQLALAAYESQGYSPEDIQWLLGKLLPQGRAAFRGTFAPIRR